MPASDSDRGRRPDPKPRPRSAPFALDLDKKAFDALSREAPIRLAYRDLFERRPEPSPRVRAWAAGVGVQARALREVARERGGRSEKLLLALPDGYSVETVRIRRRDGHTACVSSQVGCAFACQFCASGQAGLKRHLSPGEIVEQVLRLGRRVNRIVFMGIGEPLHNYDSVLKAIRILRDRNGLALPTSGITLSTIGIPSALARLREEHLAIQLTISLHATTQDVRARLIPGSRNHDIEEVVARSLSWADRHNRTATFVYLVLPGINDAPDDAARLARMLAGRRARVNLMRWNPVDGVPLERTPDRALGRFRRALDRARIPVSVRDTQGRDIAAACGQLWLRDTHGTPLRRKPKSRR